MNIQLIEEAIKTISAVVRAAESPAVFTSFGKDSMALLGVIREAGLLSAVQLVSFRHPAFPSRYASADRIIAQWSLDPLIVFHGWNSIITGNGRVDLLGTARTRGSQIHIPVANMVWQNESTIWSCALDNQLPHGVDLIKLDFDLVLLGSKQSDADPVVGKVEVQSVAEQFDGRTSLLFPLRNWTDSDIWDFVRTREIPFDTNRYVVSAAGTIVDDLTYSEHSENLPVCTACVNPANHGEVRCPKFNKSILCRAGSLQHRNYPPKPRDGMPEVVAL